MNVSEVADVAIDEFTYSAEQPEEKQEEILAHTHSIRSRNEMHAYVQSLGNRQ